MTKKEQFLWSQPATVAFEELKRAMITAPVLQLSNFDIPFVIETDACYYGLGVVLMQQNYPLAFLSKALGAKNLGLSIYGNY